MVRNDYAIGIIPINQNHKILLIKHQKGHWGFPKGHAETGELQKRTAERELKEETNLNVDHFLEIDPLKEHYTFKDLDTLVHKEVIYYLAYVKGKLKCQESEIAEARWCTFEEAEQIATYKEMKVLIHRVKDYLGNWNFS